MPIHYRLPAQRSATLAPKLGRSPTTYRLFSVLPPNLKEDPSKPVETSSEAVKASQPPPTGLRGIIQRLFDNPHARPRFSDSNKPPLVLPSTKEPEYPCLNTTVPTRLLYWYCPDLQFAQSDFERIGPPNMNFRATRARDPANMTRWMGYFLEFGSNADAAAYFTHTQGYELCGMPLRLKFSGLETPGFTSPLLAKTNIPRKAHALVLGLPPNTSEHALLRALWDFDLIDDDKLAIERLPLGKVKFGGNPMLLRFKTERECARFVRVFHRETLANSESPVICEVVD